MARPSSTLPSSASSPASISFRSLVLGIGFDCLARNFDSLVELFGVAVGVHLALVSAQG